MGTRSERIENIRREYIKEWLLIAVDQIDHAKTKPISGRLLAHSPDPQEIIRQSIHPTNGNKTIFIDYSERQIPKGVASIFHA